MKPAPVWTASFRFAGRRILGCAVFALGLSSLVSSGRAQSYSENFNSGTAAGWTVASGTYSVVSGTYNCTSLTAGPNVAYYANTSWDTGYTYTASVRLYGSGTANCTGLVYYYKDLNNYYEVELDGAKDSSGNGTVQLYEHVGSAAGTVVATGSFTSPGGGNFVTVTIARSGPVTTIEVNGTTVITRTQTALTGGGKIGAVCRWAGGWFDNISVSARYKTVYPKLAGVMYSPTYENTAFQTQIAKYDLAVLGFWRSWNHSGLTIQQAVQQIKARNPSIILGNYTILESADNSVNGDTQIQAALNSGVGPTGNGGTWTPNDWWARTSAGAQITEGSTLATNLTAFVTPNANGDRYSQWYGKWVYGAYFQPVPEFDYVFSDVTNFRPTISADWKRTGTNASPTDPTVGTYYRQGIAAYWTQMNALDPSLLILANVDGQTSLSVGYLREPEYQYKVGSALYEIAMGYQHVAEEDYSGWYNMMTSYRTLLANTAAPNIVLVGIASTIDGKAADLAIQGNYGGGAAYAFARYALASILMDNGYAEFHPPRTYTETTDVWFDEFDLAGTSTTSWLGAPIDPPQTTAYQNGVFVRRFQNGMAIVNPRTNPDLTTRTAQTITPPSGYKRFVGTQDSTTNNGAVVTTITIQAGDGILLVKQ